MFLNKMIATYLIHLKWQKRHTPPLWLPGQTFKITSFQQFLGGLEDTELKTGNLKSLTRKPSYSSFFSVLCPDLKNVFFGKIH